MHNIGVFYIFQSIRPRNHKEKLDSRYQVQVQTPRPPAYTEAVQIVTLQISIQKL